jgi:hypothetical protein
MFRPRWEDNTKIDHEDMGWYGLDLSGSGQGPVDGSCDHGNERSASIKYCEILE